MSMALKTTRKATTMPSDYVTFGTSTVPTSLVVRLLAMEDKGVRFTVEADGRLHLGPKAAVTADDLAYCRAHRDQVLACIQHINKLCEAPL
jgi:hypothetical protein